MREGPAPLRKAVVCVPCRYVVMCALLITASLAENCLLRGFFDIEADTADERRGLIDGHLYVVHTGN